MSSCSPMRTCEQRKIRARQFSTFASPPTRPPQSWETGIVRHSSGARSRSQPRSAKSLRCTRETWRSLSPLRTALAPAVCACLKWAATQQDAIEGDDSDQDDRDGDDEGDGAHFPFLGHPQLLKKVPVL